MIASNTSPLIAFGKQGSIDILLKYGKMILIPEAVYSEIIEKQTSRMQRIAKGSGTSVSEIRALLKQYRMLNEMIKSQSQISEKGLDQKTMMKLAKKFGRKMKF